MSTTSVYAKCKECGQYGYVNSHRCPPLWEWRCDNNFGPDEWELVRGKDPEDAAVKAAELYDAEDYSLVRGNRATIQIRDMTTKVVTAWDCYAESVPTYYATESDEEA